MHIAIIITLSVVGIATLAVTCGVSYVLWYDWGMLDAWSTYKVWPQMLAVITVSLAIALACGGAIYKLTRSVPPQSSTEAWEQWYTEHQKTCPECGGGADLAMCLDAFERMQAAFKEDRDREKKASN